jgi:hypothetical protein
MDGEVRMSYGLCILEDYFLADGSFLPASGFVGGRLDGFEEKPEGVEAPVV